VDISIVRLHGYRPASAGADFFNDAIRSVGCALIGDSDIGTFRRQPQRDCGAYAPASARYKSSFSLKFAHYPVFL
jgi:hypothetical protein